MQYDLTTKKYDTHNRASRIVILLMGLTIIGGQQVFATEGGMGRSITGMQVMPLNGILPSQEGLIFSVSSIYYEGRIDKARNTAIAGRIVGGLDYKVSYNLLNALYVWRATERWSFGSSVGIPFQYTGITGSLQGPYQTRSKHDSNTNVADIVFSPIIADYHFNSLNHLVFGLTIFAPTGSYDKNRLANAGQNTWTFVPNMAYTTILPQQNIELTGVAALEFYTRNKDTDYRNGTTARLDGIALKRFGTSGWGAGLNVGWIQQLEDDKGTLATRLNGNRGRSFGIGPIVSYEKKIGNTQVSTSLRWIHEVEVKNRPKGNAFQLSFTAQF